jgi:hypothetical protein
VISYRFTVLAVALLFLSFATMQWLFTVRQVMPNAKLPTFHRIGTSDDPRYNQEDAFESDSDEVRDGLRRVLLNTGNNLLASPCNGYLRDQYIAAATKYAHAWLSIAPCEQRCDSKGWARLELAQKAFGTPFDKTVRDLMRRIHETDTIREGDFRQEVVVTVARMASDAVINPSADPAARQTFKEFRRPLTCRP